MRAAAASQYDWNRLFDVSGNYESKFILDSFLLGVFTAKKLRCLAAIVDLFPRLHPL